MGVRDYIREKFFPHIWCAGCGHGIVLNNLLRAVEESELDKNSIVMVSGIGCSSRISGYVDFHTLHTLHGRALAFAAGVKMSRPELQVLIPMGDGDALAIGGNHFLHACRRNMDMTAIVMNNRIYGMTGGQYSPLSGKGVRASSSPQGCIDASFDIVNLAMASGAGFVARTTTYHVKEITEYLKQAILHKGFSVLEIMSQCPTHFGRKNELGDAVSMLQAYKENTVHKDKRARDSDAGLIQRGIFLQEEFPEYCTEYNKQIQGMDKV
ncbi:MAG: 2-oxoacid:ferredoxin oxidoreductase subunit beta [Thermodesulfobacteriota bacterium]